MASTRNTPNKNAGGPKVGGAAKGSPAKKAPARKAPAKAPAKKAAAKPPAPAPRKADAAPKPTERVEVRRGNKVVYLGDLVKDSIKVTLSNGKLSVTGSTADAAEEDSPASVSPETARAYAPGEPPSEGEFDDMVAGAVDPNKAVQFEQDPRVLTTIHEGATVAHENDGKRT